MSAQAAKKMLMAERKRWSLEGALSTGSTLLNLACTETSGAAFLRGGYYYLVGDSASGKTWFSLSCLAEACRNPIFDKYRLIYDDVEGGALMDIERYFGKELARRLEPPAQRKGRSVNSTTVESFYYHVWDAVKERRPFIYVLDSQDALGSVAALGKFEKMKEASESGETTAGSFGDGKAKYHSEHLRQVLSGLRRRDSILLVLGQTRDNLGFGFEKKTRSGGRALRFYANLEIWTSVIGKMKKRINGKDRTIGIKVLAEIRKNRVTGKVGKDRAVVVPIMYNFGIDDVGSCVDFLISEQYWQRTGKRCYDAKEVFVEGSRDEIIKAIEQENMEKKICKLAANVWKSIEESCTESRKARYV